VFLLIWDLVEDLTRSIFATFVFFYLGTANLIWFIDNEIADVWLLVLDDSIYTAFTLNFVDFLGSGYKRLSFTDFWFNSFNSI